MAFQQLREAAPQDVPVAPPAREPLLPSPHNLSGVPAQSATVAGNAIVGIVAPHHGCQMGMLLQDRLVPVVPTPLGHCCQGTGVSAFGRYLPYHGPAIPRLAPHMGQAEEVERSAIRTPMARSLWSSVAEVDEACLVGMERQPVPLKTLAQDRQNSFGVLEAFECHNEVISVPDQDTSPPKRGRTTFPNHSSST